MAAMNERKPRRNRRADWGDKGQSRGAKYLEGIHEIDYKDHELLRKFMTERGKIMPRRLTGANSRQQREITRAIRRARVMGLLR